MNDGIGTFFIEFILSFREIMVVHFKPSVARSELSAFVYIERCVTEVNSLDKMGIIDPLILSVCAVQKIGPIIEVKKKETFFC